MKSILQSVALLSALICTSAKAFSQQDEVRYPYIKYIGIHAGTQGVGISGFMPISSALTVQTALSFLPFDIQVGKVYSGYNTKSDMSARFSNVHATLEWAPLHASENIWKYLVASAGVGYFFKADGRINTRLADKYHYGEIEIDPSHLGTITTRVSWKNTLAPYLGVGLQHIEISPRFGLGITIGSYYLKQPAVSITGTNLLVGNESNTPIVRENIKNYRFLPVLQLNFSHQIK